jgi:hypothetical protein
MRQRHNLVTRVIQMRHGGVVTDSRAANDPGDPAAATLASLEGRIAHLEELLEGLQDSVHRESTRQSNRIAYLEAAIEPEALAVLLSRHARERGL